MTPYVSMVLKGVLARGVSKEGSRVAADRHEMSSGGDGNALELENSYAAPPCDYTEHQ